ncbi:hypothetical protein IV38_GL000665 [Lactobacillus selangorensis]|uniref:Major facilitator superfamily (MFS) profile domain-containing protein n=1 Tax=Lactobacillus selangorensis TaxID=81857 RepID=A0A0R2FZP4_9LACO|nr:MDR family MFS transporter [Lactobacillus selangorensis]KRN29775.1 hypothetical protein IV38_GL000665 [Lactobacillus selangorensis]KRN33696.1 hypothetical protein IV40_GL000003 [Lactobacillus selangorensis]
MSTEKKKTNVLLVTIAIFIATFLSAVEGTIVSTAMPTIVESLHGMKLMNWIYSIYLLTNAMTTPIWGKLADRMGRKPVFIAGLVIFIVGSSLCGLSQNMLTLIGFRALQGIGAGAITPVSFTMLADIYPIEERARIMGLNGSAWGIASIFAPLIGGFIVEKLTWHWIFFINVPIGLITLVMIMAYFHEDWKASKAPIDYVGSLSLMATLLFVLYAFQVIGEAPINYGLVIGLFVAAVIAFLMFVRTEKRVADPIIDLKLFENRTFVVQSLIAALVSGFLIGFDAYVPMWTQGILGLPATMAGFAVTPSSLMWIVGSFVAGRLFVKFAPKQILWGSLSFLLVATLLFANIPITTPFWFFFVIATICGIGFGITITTTTVTTQNSVAPNEVGVATSFNTLSRTLGQTLMVAIYGIVLNVNIARGIKQFPKVTNAMMNKFINPSTATSLPHNLLPQMHQILYTGIHHIYWLSVVVIILAFVANAFDRKQKIL